MASLSLCMITKDEEQFLSRCLDSVKDIVDEIIIVDTGSKDKTKEIAKGFGAKIIESGWKDDFSAARNESLKHATKDWILVLDADEVISEKDLKRINGLTEDADVDGYKLIQRNYYGKAKRADDYEESKGFAGFIASPLVRLFRNNKGYEFRNVIHEVIEDSIREKNGKIVVVDILIHHLAALKSKDFSSEKDKKYYELEKKQIRLTPDNPKPHYELGRMHLHKKEFKEAIEYFEKAFELLQGYQEKLAIHQLVYPDLGEAYIGLREFEKAKPVLKKAVGINRKDKNAHFYLGLAYDEEGDLDKAIGHYEEAIKNNPKAENAYNNLAIIYLKKKMHGDAKRILSKAVDIGHPKKEQMKKLLDRLSTG